MSETTQEQGSEDSFHYRAEAALAALFSAARERDELHFLLSLTPEMRGTQGPGWNTAREAVTAYREYTAFLSEWSTTGFKTRVALAFYCHLAEAAGLYEVPKNMLRICGGQHHLLWPFRDLVRTHTLTGQRIAPNANKVFQDLAGHAAELGFDALAEVFRDAFDPDLRNGYAHADYVIWGDGIRLPRRNGGYAKVVSWPEFDRLFHRGVRFFGIILRMIDLTMAEYIPPRRFRGALANSPDSLWEASYDPATGVFTIRDNVSLG
jgi:hypothetical protein